MNLNEIEKYILDNYKSTISSIQDSISSIKNIEDKKECINNATCILETALRNIEKLRRR